MSVPVWRSDNGATWSATGSIALPRKRTQVNELITFEDDLYAIGTDGPRLAVWRSPDGGSWSRLRDRPSFAANPTGSAERIIAGIDGAATGHGRIVVSGAYWPRDVDPSIEPVVWTTTDGQRWQRTDPTLPPPDNGVSRLGTLPRSFVGVVATNRPIVCAQGDSANLLLTSRDGQEWDRVKGARPRCALRDVTFDTMSARYYALADAAVDDPRDVVLTSKNLRSWKEVFRLPDEFEGMPWSPEAGAIESAGGGIIVVGEAAWGGDRDGGTVWTATSPDGETWELQADWPTETESDVGIQPWAIGDERVVLGIGNSAWYADLDDFGIESVEPLGKRAQRQANRELGRINGMLAEDRPDTYVGDAVSVVPGGAPSLARGALPTCWIRPRGRARTGDAPDRRSMRLGRVATRQARHDHRMGGQPRGLATQGPKHRADRPAR